MVAQIFEWLRNHYQEVTLLIGFAAALASWLSARAAKRAAIETKKASQGSLFSALLDAYGSSEMLQAMITLRAFKSRHGKDFADEFRRLRRDDYPAIQEIDHARRHVSHFFQKVYKLNTIGFLGDVALKALATKGQVEFFREVIEPLEAAISVDYDRSGFEGLGGLYGIEPHLPPMANP